MLIQRLQISHIRNLSRASLPRLNRINVFCGINGSGKTSLLEALHLLIMGKSFRHAMVRPVLQEGEAECTVFAELSTSAGRLTLGAQRYRDGSKPLLKINGAPANALSELVELVPMQVLSADSFELILGGPGFRREFLDRGLFHVEPKFYPVWRLAQRALKQRNSLLRHGKISTDQIILWSREYARYGEEIDRMRRHYLDNLLPACHAVIAQLSPDAMVGLEATYSRGWSKDVALEHALIAGIEKDLQQGFTRQGPHRADLKIMIDEGTAAETLSRGQLKILAAGFHLAQTNLLHAKTGKKSILLVDDLSAELDRSHRQSLCSALEDSGLQVFVTSVEPEDLANCWSNTNDVEMFHVERGHITPLSEITQGN
ncbi:MAG: replication/repair protein RecF [Verrucomicrobiaceae bacterium]|nr:replication/repair protein RecF [Verrucomicrobiaceae bacterium]